VAAVTSPWPHGDPNAVVHAVLRGPGFGAEQTSNTPPTPSLWSLFWGWVGHSVGTFLDWAFNLFGKTRGVGTILGTVIIVAVAAAIVFAIVRIAITLSERRRPKSRAFTTSVALTRRRPAREWAALAAKAAQAGAYGDAIGALFSAALAGFDAAEIVHFDDTRTAGEYRTIVRSKLGATPAFDELASRFVVARYGPEDADERSFEAAQHAYGSLEPLFESR
jgi:hypothetical protein